MSEPYFVIGRNNVRLFVSALVIHLLRLERKHNYTIHNYNYEGLINDLYRLLGTIKADYEHHPINPFRIVHGDYLSNEVLKCTTDIISTRLNVVPNMGTVAKLLRMSIEAGSDNAKIRVKAVSQLRTFLDLPKDLNSILTHVKTLLGGGDRVIDLGNGFYQVMEFGEDVFFAKHIQPTLEESELELRYNGNLSETPYIAHMAINNNQLTVNLLPGLVHLKEK